MKPDEVLKYCLENLEGSILVESWGEKGIFYNPGHVLKRGVYILTVKEKDGDNDKGSNLDRSGVYRVNLGVRKGTFIKLFGTVPKRPGAGGIVEMDYDFSAVDQMLPHPVYAWMGWICVLNLSEDTFEEWMDFEARLKAKYKDEYVPSEVFLAIRKKDNCVVGMIDFRHPLSDFLSNFGGNIGYSVRPSERQKGYASEMLRLILPVCCGFGESKVLLTCDKENIQKFS